MSSQGTADLLRNGAAFPPAGDASASVRVGGSTLDFESRSARPGTVTQGRMARDVGAVRANIDLPIASRARDVPPGLGRLSINANAEAERLSDFDTLLSYG